MNTAALVIGGLIALAGIAVVVAVVVLAVRMARENPDPGRGAATEPVTGDAATATELSESERR